jgi:hypothetical protein
MAFEVHRCIHQLLLAGAGVRRHSRVEWRDAIYTQQGTLQVICSIRRRVIGLCDNVGLEVELEGELPYHLLHSPVRIVKSLTAICKGQ